MTADTGSGSGPRRLERQAPGTTRVLQGHLVRDEHGCSFGVIDFNPDLSDPAVALVVTAADGTQVDRPVLRIGREFSCGAGGYRAVVVRTDPVVYVDLEPLVATGDDR